MKLKPNHFEQTKPPGTQQWLFTKHIILFDAQPNGTGFDPQCPLPVRNIDADPLNPIPVLQQHTSQITINPPN